MLLGQKAEDKMNELNFEKENHNNNFKRIIIILILILIIAAAVSAAIFFDSREKDNTVAVSDTTSKKVELSLEAGTVYSHAVSDTHTFFFTADNVKIASSSGKFEQSLHLKASNPISYTSGKYTIIADKGGKTAHIFKGGELKKSLTIEEDINIAKINKNGYSLFITKGNIHKNSAIVFSPSGEELFKWKSGSMSVVSADISDNDRDISLSVVKTDNGIVSTNLYMFNIAKDKPFANEVIQDEIFGAMQFEGSYLYCIGSAKTYIYNDYGKCISNIDYEGRDLLNYVIADGTVVLLYSDSNTSANGSLVRSYTPKGKLQGEFYTSSKARFIDLKQNSIAVDNNRVISILDASCNEKFRLNLKTTLSDFRYMETPSIAIGISATGAEIIEVRRQ